MAYRFALVLGVVASLKGLKIDPAVFSAIAAISAGLTGLRQKLSWRERADTAYFLHDMLRGLLSTIDNKTSRPPTADEVSKMVLVQIGKRFKKT
jgi:hypothetical protein